MIAALGMLFRWERNRLAIQIGPFRLVSISRVRSSRSCSSLCRLISRITPALFTTTFNCGNSWVTRTQSESTSPALLTSLSMIHSFGSCFCASSSFPRSRPVAMTVLPRSKRFFESSKPIPPAPPVIKTVFPWRSIFTPL